MLRKLLVENQVTLAKATEIVVTMKAAARMPGHVHKFNAKLCADHLTSVSPPKNQ